MQLKKATSDVHQSNANVLNVDAVSPQVGVYSDNAFVINARNKKRVPEALQNTLRDRMSERKTQRKSVKGDDEPSESRKSKMGAKFRTKMLNVVHNIKEVSFCEICEAQIPKKKNKNKQMYLSQCQHKDSFCESCLHHYVIYKVNTFQEVMCPHQGCPMLLDQTTSFYKGLPSDIQKKYNKIHQFYQTAKDPNMQLCPKEQCEGIIKIIMQNVMQCNMCHKQFCSKCLLQAHEGQCDNHEVDFFQRNLHYRRCKKCKFIVEKQSGCSHMTCRCGYHFCYVCGDRWTSAHYGVHDENGRLVNPEGAPFQNNQPCCDCTCMNELCGDTLASICKLPIKFFLCLLFVPLMIFIFISRDVFVILGMFITTIVAGLFGFSIEIITEQEGILLFLSILFFPITMLLGVVVAFREVFCDVVPQLCNQYWEMWSNGATSICGI